jgi:hypothetical protein
MPGAQCTRSLACKVKKHTSVVTTGPPENPAFLHAMVLTVSFVLSPVTGLFCHRYPADNSAELDASVGASGPHDFAVHLKRRSSCSAISVHRIPCPTSVTIARAPLCEGRDGGGYSFDLGRPRSKIFFAEGLDMIL